MLLFRGYEIKVKSILLTFFSFDTKKWAKCFVLPNILIVCVCITRGPFCLFGKLTMFLALMYLKLYDMHLHKDNQDHV